MDKNANRLIVTLLFGICLIVSAFVLAQAVRDFKGADRYVTVKGLVEKEVKADLALWLIKFRVSGDDLQQAQVEAAAQRTAVLSFLKEKGIGDGDIGASLRVVDRKAQEYGENRPGAARFIIENTVQVRSTDVDTVRNASQQTDALLRLGVVLADDNACSPGPNYTFTALNSIKPDMLAEATQNARRAAEQFAADSGSAVGAIRRANQGVFSLDERDRVAENSGDNYNCSPATPNKKVRVVTTIDYFLAK